jgi:hypothetical protein
MTPQLSTPAAARESRVRLPWWVKLLLAYLAGVTIIGKGPTYIGYPPVFWGEIVMVICLLVIAPWAARTEQAKKNRFITAAIVLFMLLGAVLTARSYPNYHLNALRDAAIWYYGLFYFVGIGLASRENIADRVWKWLRIFWIVALVWNTADLLSHGFLSHSGPIIPWRGVNLFFNSTHEAGQNLALGAMIVLCTGTLRKKPLWQAFLIPVALVGLGAFAMAEGRGMRVGVACGILAALLFRIIPGNSPFFSRRLLVLSVAAIPLLALASVVYSSKLVSMANLDRFEQADPTDPTGTANWRAIWWEHLYAAVMQTDPAFGLGFGQSLHIYNPLLAHDNEVWLVRSPHNFNMTIFSRMGIVGVSLWFAVLALGLGTLFVRNWIGTARGRPFSQERRDELTFWMMMLVCTWVNSSFGVLMEGPVLGIWFWFALGFANARAITPGEVPETPLERLRRVIRLRSRNRTTPRLAAIR